MEHVVFFPAPDGTPAFRRVAGLEDAVRLVEHLRNVEGVAEVSVHALGDEVPLAFRTWYRVEVPAGTAAVPAQAEAVAAPVPVDAAAPVAEPVAVVEAGEGAEEPEAAGAVDVPQLEEPVGASSNGSGHRPDAASLGFFAT